MKHNYLKSCLLFVGLNLMAFAGFSQSDRTIINIDFGPDNQMSAAPWNNVTNAKTGSVADLLNSEGQPTGLTITVTDPFNSWNLNGVTADDTLGIPYSASRESFYGNVGLFNGGEFPFASVTLSNLDVTKAYSFAFFASRADVNDNRETLYTVEGHTTETATLNATRNVSRMARVSNIKPKEDGTIIIAVEPGPNNNNGSKFYYLSAMRISYSNTVAGISPDISAGKINVYPNPAVGSVAINTGGESRVESVQLLNLSGVKVLEKTAVNGSVENLDVSGLAQGLYYMQVQTNKGRFHSKLVVNK
ncbi:T9SS type A sorting domain-containing protein [Rufibacter roseus]|uniref:T9SS type A sorting domain-containing protein n=1 Tax=Rufibacter roseus TaxID=1567108 RepID=A0ABW2DMS7_9BACT|nr:T9SS type A sorting domain-containing protein [Rufibacter roseus]